MQAVVPWAKYADVANFVAGKNFAREILKERDSLSQFLQSVYRLMAELRLATLVIMLSIQLLDYNLKGRPVDRGSFCRCPRANSMMLLGLIPLRPSDESKRSP